MAIKKEAVVKEIRELTDHELNIVNSYCSTGNYSVKRTAELLDFQEREIKTVINRPVVRSEIGLRQVAIKKNFNMSEVDILNRLWEEANNVEKGSNHNARITALVWIGKHLGMWQEKKQEEAASYTYNIVNYATASQLPTEEKLIENTQEEVSILPANVSLTSYN